MVEPVDNMASFQATVNRLEKFLDALDHLDVVTAKQWNISEDWEDVGGSRWVLVINANMKTVWSIHSYFKLFVFRENIFLKD